MATQLEHTSVVMLGAWNPAIVNPSWLHQQHIIRQPPTNVSNLAFQPIGRGIIFEYGGFGWELNEARLVVKCQRMRNCGTVAARVLDCLPHTPIQAVGTNFVVKTDEVPPRRANVPTLDSIRLAAGKTRVPAAQVSWHTAAKINNDTVLTLTVTRNPEVVVVSFNFHRNNTGARAPGIFARRWGRDRKMAMAILGDRFGLELK